MMKRFLLRAVDFIEMKLSPFNLRIEKSNSIEKRKIRIMIWSRIILRLITWLIALFLIERFAVLMKNIFFP
jgi:hypothetical protein